MAGAMRRVGEYLGLVEQTEYDDDQVEAEVAPTRQSYRPVADLTERRPAPPVAAVPGPARSVSAPQIAGDVSRIETVSPRTYNDARTVGEHYRAGVPVIMNLSDIGDGDAKRLVDFAAGLVFAAHGSINRITAKVFLLSPENIVVSDEDKQAIAAGGFYNQS